MNNLYITTVFSNSLPRKGFDEEDKGGRLIFDEAIEYAFIDKDNYLEVIDLILTMFLKQEPDKTRVIYELLMSMEDTITQEHKIDKDRLHQIIFKGLAKIKKDLDDEKKQNN